MKNFFIAISFATAVSSVMAQSNDTITKAKAAGEITMGVRDSSGALSYTLAMANMLATTLKFASESLPT